MTNPPGPPQNPQQPAYQPPAPQQQPAAPFQQPAAQQQPAPPFQQQPGYQPSQPEYPSAPQGGGRGSGVAKVGMAMGARIIISVVVLGVLAIGGYVWNVATGDPQTAGVGDCLIDAAADDIKIVKCDDPKAAFKVEGKVEDVTEVGFQTDINGAVCKAYPTAESGFWSGEKGGKGAVLCLSKVK